MGVIENTSRRFVQVAMNPCAKFAKFLKCHYEISVASQKSCASHRRSNCRPVRSTAVIPRPWENSLDPNFVASRSDLPKGHFGLLQSPAPYDGGKRDMCRSLSFRTGNTAGLSDRLIP